MPAPKRARNRRIRALVAEGLTLTEVGRRYGITRQRVGQILRPRKAAARKRFRYALEVGRLARPDQCEDCGRVGPVDGHHPDYTRPLVVEWLCKLCHAARHRSARKEAA